MTDTAGGYPRSDEDEPYGSDFAEEHADVSHAEELEGGPEGVPDPEMPSGLAGEDPTDTGH